MDLDYNPHAERARRKSRSSTNINHLSLAPLTVKLPIDGDYEDALQSLGPLNSSRSISSYIQGKSAPTTPRLLSHSPAGPRSRSHHRRTPSAPGVHVSKSTTHLAGIRGDRTAATATHGATTPGGGSSRRRRFEDRELRGGDDSDWFLRTGALMTTETREYKGQSWLVSRQSSTSLAAMRDDDEEAFERELAMERDLASRRTSRRTSFATGDGGDDDFVSPLASRLHSRFGSRSQSVAGRRGGVMTPRDRDRDAHDDGYVGRSDLQQEGVLTGPDFVNLDERLEELERDDPQGDEAAVRRLVRHGHGGAGSWIGNLMGWPLFSLQENDDEDDEEDEDDSLTDATSQAGRSGWSARHFEGVSNACVEKMPPPATDEGAWKDAAWLFSVATKVMF